MDNILLSALLLNHIILLIKEAMQKKYVDKLKRKHGFVNFAV
jgi:hypothetical protein